MATKAWIENEYVFVTTDVSVAPSDAIDVPDGTTPFDLVIDNGVLRLKTDTEKLVQLKQQKLKELDSLTTEYITTYYPLTKQNSDSADVAYWQNYLLMYGIDPVKSRQTLAYTIVSFFDQGWSFEQCVQFFLSQFPDPNPTKEPGGPIYWGYAVEQIIKSGIRMEWLKRVKEKCRQYISEVNNATSITELQNIVFDYSNLPFPNLPTLFKLL